MYQSRVRPRFDGRRLVVQQQPKQHRSNIDHDLTASKASFLQLLLSTSKRSLAVALVLTTCALVVVLSGCGVTYNGSGATAQTPGHGAVLNEISCGTQSLTGAQTKSCSVTLSKATKKETVVKLTSSSNAALEVIPSKVTIPAGATSVGFKALSSAVKKSVSVTISGVSEGVTKAAVITVYPASTGSANEGMLSGVSCAGNLYSGNATDACTVSLSSPATENFYVSLRTNDGAVRVPGDVTVSAGSTSVAFTTTVLGVSTAQTATLTATADGVARTFNITLSPVGTKTSAAAATLSKVSCGTQSLTGPATTSCTVYLSGSADSAMAVSLSSSNSALQVPSSVTVAQGATSAGFSATASAVKSSESATLTASSDGVSQSDVLQLLEPGAQAATQHNVQLSWNAPSDSTVPIVGYKVYRMTAGSSGYAPLSSSVDKQTSYVDSTAEGGQTYDYVVTSVDSSGEESAYSSATVVSVPE